MTEDIIPTEIEAIRIGYVNHEGIYAIRHIKPEFVWYGTTAWHPEPQAFLRAYDIDKAASRDFALSDFTCNIDPEPQRSIRRFIEMILIIIGTIATLVCFLLGGSYWNAKKNCEAITNSTCIVEFNVVPVNISEEISTDVEQ